MEPTPKKTLRHPFNPRVWTLITWIGIFLWLWSPFFLNYFQLPMQLFIEGSNGEQILYYSFTSISEFQFQWGWPFPYIVPDMTAAAAGTFPVPAVAKWEILAANILLIAFATLALVYCSQKLLPRFGLLTVFVLLTLFSLYLGLLPLVAWFAGYPWAERISGAIYFSPIFGAIVIEIAERYGFTFGDLEQRIAESRLLKPFRRREMNYETPDDSLALASQLDQEGRWEEAIDLYRAVAQQWPEQTEYVDNCIAAIEVKKSTGVPTAQ